VPADVDLSPRSYASADVHADWTFDIRGVNGPRRFQLANVGRFRSKDSRSAPITPWRSIGRRTKATARGRTLISSRASSDGQPPWRCGTARAKRSTWGSAGG